MDRATPNPVQAMESAMSVHPARHKRLGVPTAQPQSVNHQNVPQVLFSIRKITAVVVAMRRSAWTPVQPLATAVMCAGPTAVTIPMAAQRPRKETAPSAAEMSVLATPTTRKTTARTANAKTVVRPTATASIVAAEMVTAIHRHRDVPIQIMVRVLSARIRNAWVMSITRRIHAMEAVHATTTVV